MKHFLNTLVVAAFAASAVPALAEKGATTKNVGGSEMDPKVMLCSAFVTQTAPDQGSIARQLKAELSGNASVAAMSEVDLATEILKRCGTYPSSTVYDAFTM